MKFLKVVCGLGFVVVLASNVWSMSRWSEARGVYDDICYLRQAHLFQKFGLAGLNTDISRDDDHYLALKLKEIGFPNWSDQATAPCHNLMPVTGKVVVQYPPGTGFLLALFPEGFQVIPLYVAAAIVVFCFALGAISRASTIPSLMLAAAFGDAGNLPDDQPLQGELFDGAHHGGLRAWPAFSPPNSSLPGNRAIACFWQEPSGS